MAKNSSAMTRLRQTCCLGLPSTIAIPQILEELHAIVPADRYHFAWSDSLGNLTDGYFEKPDPQALDYFKHHHRQFEQDCGLTFRQMLLFGRPTGNCRWQMEKFERTRSYRELYENLGLRHCLDGVVRDRVGPVGIVFAMRRFDEPDFSASEEAQLAQTLPYIAHAIAHQGASVHSFVESDDTALIVFDAHGTPTYQSARAEELCLYALAYADHASQWEAGLGLQDSREAMTRLYERVERAFVDPAQASAVPAWDISNRWGEFQVRAYRLRAGGEDGAVPAYGVLLDKKTPIEVRVLQRVKAMALSNRQREVCFLLARGVPMADIAPMLGIAPTTLKDHAQAIYRKLGIRNRDDLIPLVS